MRFLWLGNFYGPYIARIGYFGTDHMPTCGDTKNHHTSYTRSGSSPLFPKIIWTGIEFCRIPQAETAVCYSSFRSKYKLMPIKPKR